MSMLPIEEKIYDDGRTKQAFKDETDINKILKRAQKAGTLSHLAKHEARYGDFSDFDFFEAQLKLSRGREIFDELPSEVRKEFSQSPAQFFEYVNDPKNAGKLDQLLPALSAPGRQYINLNEPREVEEPVNTPTEEVAKPKNNAPEEPPVPTT